MIRVLAISPRFAPTNGADTHRLRLLLPHAAEAGWQVEVLAVESCDVVGPKDAWLEEKLPKDVAIHRVRAWSLRGWGLNGLAQRSIWPLWRKGCELLEDRQFDLVFFSTTEFALHVLGPLWKRHFGVPFCMDYQDPWVNDYYRMHPEVVPPGGRLKYTLADKFHRLAERFVVGAASGFLTVSADYLTVLDVRYGKCVKEKPRLVRPFPAEPSEFAGLETTQASSVEQRSSRVWRYFGRGGADMHKAASAFFKAWARASEAGVLSTNNVRFEAIGTSYAASGKGDKTFEPLVAGTALSSSVYESPDRIEYSEVLKSLMQSDALVVFGSDDSAYTASKIYPYLLAGKPFLAIFHERSQVVDLMKQVAGGVCVTFNEQTTVNELVNIIFFAWFESGKHQVAVPLDRSTFEAYTARVQAQEVAEWFKSVRDCTMG